MKKLLVIVSALFMSACTIVGPGERAVRYNFGKVSSDVLQPGTHLWVPYFAGSKTINVQVHAIETVTSSGTKDQQEVTSKIVVNLQIDPAKVVDVVTNVGGENALLDRIIPLVQESINANVSKFSAEEILTKRAALKESIEALVKEQVTKYGVIVHDISVKDLQYSREYADAIEKKQIAEQQAKQADYVTQKATAEARAAVETAKGLAEAQKLVKATITQELMQMKAIEKWDGKFPQVMGSQTLPFINLTPNTAR
jgi:prohibitin 1